LSTRTVLAALLALAGCNEGPIPNGRYVASGSFPSSAGQLRVCGVLIVDGEDVLLVDEGRSPHGVIEYRGTFTEGDGCTLNLSCERTKVEGDLRDKEDCPEPDLPVECSANADGSISLEYGVYALVAFEEDAVCSEFFTIDKVY
jgi:hypothetical protein